MVLVAQVIAERLADGLKQFAGAAREIDFGHQKGRGRLAMVRVR